jgi:hypothetical protein
MWRGSYGVLDGVKVTSRSMGSMFTVVDGSPPMRAGT